VSAYRRVGVSACRRIGVSAYRRGGERVGVLATSGLCAPRQHSSEEHSRLAERIREPNEWNGHRRHADTPMRRFADAPIRFPPPPFDSFTALRFIESVRLS